MENDVEMSCESDSNVNIFKVKIVGEEFIDILIDWSLAINECASKQIFRQLERITGIPIENTSEFYIWKLVNQQVTVAIPAFNDGPGKIFSNFKKDKVMNVLKEGDKFYLATFMRCHPNRRLIVGYSLVDVNAADETKCTRNFCHYSHTRPIINMQRKLVTDKSLALTLSRRLDISGDDYQWNSVFRELNILQYLNINCSCNPNTDDELLYARGRG